MKLLIIILTSACLYFTNDVHGQNVYMYNYFGNLPGVWRFEKADKVIYEEWRFSNDSTLEGISYKVVGNDTTMLETMRLEKRGSVVKYIPMAYGQNNDEPVEFTLTELASTKEGVTGRQAHHSVKVLFGNPLHDSPKYISYSISGAEIKALVGDDKEFSKGNSLEFNFKKVKNR